MRMRTEDEDSMSGSKGYEKHNGSMIAMMDK